MGRRILAIVALAVLVGACSKVVSYRDPAGPRFAGPLPGPAPRAVWHDTLRVVSFNVEHGERVDSAIVALRSDARTAHPDILLLQEMGEDGVRQVAEALAMGWVYYPAVRYKADGHHFGNAVLSRWPIVSDEKILLPGQGVFGRTRRIATAATVQVGATPVRVYSVHLGTPVNMARRDRADQLRTVLADAAGHPYVIVGGDLNSHGLGEAAVRRGYAWPTEDGPRTVTFGRWDHILLKGVSWSGRPEDAGTVEDNRGASDHRPVWAVGVLR